jgi:hypothetical protein
MAKNKATEVTTISAISPGDWLKITYPEQPYCYDGEFLFKVSGNTGSHIVGDLYYADGSREWMIFEKRLDQFLDVSNLSVTYIIKIDMEFHRTHEDDVPTRDFPEEVPQSEATISLNIARRIAHGYLYSEGDWE